MRIIVIPFTGLTGRVDTQHKAFFNGLLTGADIELTVDVVQVFFYRFRRYEQFGGNFLVAQSLCQQIQDFEFAIGQGLN